MFNVQCSIKFRTFASIMTPLISFIITYHNESDAFLQACLDSIRALRFAEDEAEIIVVDDGSETPLALDYPLSAIRHRLIRQEHAGLSVARNTGIDAAKGQYIQFVDADDRLVPDAFETVLGQLRGESADVVLFRSMRTLSRKNAPPKGKQGGGFDGASFLRRRNLRAAAWGYAFKREILGDLRFRPGLLHEDELFTPQLILRAKSLVELKVKAYFYRQHSGTITSSRSPIKVQMRLNDIRFIIRELRSFDNPVLERRIRQLTVDYLQKTWTLTRSLRELRRRSKELRREGFLPLPVRCYSLRYLLTSLVF